jgi:hypothetical protein
MNQADTSCIAGPEYWKENDQDRDLEIMAEHSLENHALISRYPNNRMSV